MPGIPDFVETLGLGTYASFLWSQLAGQQAVSGFDPFTEKWPGFARIDDFFDAKFLGRQKG